MNAKGFKVSFNDTEGLWVATSKLHTSPPPHFNEKQDSPALTEPAICVSVLSLVCRFVVCVCFCCVVYMLV